MVLILRNAKLFILPQPLSIVQDRQVFCLNKNLMNL